MRQPRLGFDGLPVDMAAARARASVTERAIDRWIERVESIPRELARERILCEAVLFGLELGASRVIADGLSFRLRRGQVMTLGRKGC